LVEGKSVWSIPKKSLKLDQSLQAAIQLTDALRYALSLELIYLDLHTGNIMVDDSSDTKIVDLASFFTFDELFHFATNEEQNKEEQQKKNKAKKQKKNKKNGINDQLSQLKEKKLRQFFKQNWRLLVRLQGESKKKEKSRGSKGTKSKNEEYDQRAVSMVCSDYFDRICETCMVFVRKSDLDREQKINMYAAIKKLAWHYSEDVEDELNTPIDAYFDKLTDILKS